jgi:putative transposase
VDLHRSRNWPWLHNVSTSDSLAKGEDYPTFYKWRQKYGGLVPSELRKLKQLEEENSKLKRIVADLSLDKAMLQDVLSKKL